LIKSNRQLVVARGATLVGGFPTADNVRMAGDLMDAPATSRAELMRSSLMAEEQAIPPAVLLGSTWRMGFVTIIAPICTGQ